MKLRGKNTHIILMIIIWAFGLAFLGYTHFTVSGKKKSDRQLYLKNFKMGRELFKKGTLASYLKSWEFFDQAAKYSHNKLELWAWFAMLESSIAYEYQLKRGLFEKYRNLGVSLISEKGEGVLTSENEAVWNAASGIMRLAFSSGLSEYRDVYFLSNRYLGFFPDNPWLKLLKARALTHVGKHAAALDILKSIKHIPQAAREGIFLSLEYQDKKTALEFFRVIEKISEKSLFYEPLKCLLYNSCDKQKISVLLKHRSPNLREIASYALAANGVLPDKTIWEPGDSNLGFIFTGYAMEMIRKGKKEKVLPVMEKLGKLRRDYRMMRLIRTEEAFIEGNPEKSLKILGEYGAVEKEYLAKYLWFSGKFSEAAKAAPTSPWSTLLKSQKNSFSGIFSSAWNFRLCIEDKNVSSTPGTSSVLVYDRMVNTKILINSFLKCGQFKNSCSNLIASAWKLVSGASYPQSASYLRMAAKTAILAGKYSKALRNLRKLCFLGVKKKTRGTVCPSVEALYDDRLLLLKLLTGPHNPEQDSELALGQSEKLLANVKDEGTSKYFRVRNALMKIRLLPGASEQIVNRILPLYDGEKSDVELQKVFALIDVHRGKFQDAKSKWQKFFKNDYDASLELARLLYDFGQVQIIKSISDEMLKNTELVKTVSDNFEYIRARALNLMGDTAAWGILEKLQKQGFKDDDFLPEYLTAMLNIRLMNPKSEEFVNRCKNATKQIGEIRKSNKEGAAYFRIMQLTICEKADKNNPLIISELKKIPGFHPFRKMAEKLIR